MAMMQNRELIDRLTRKDDDARSGTRGAAPASAANYNPLGLKFGNGARVIDLVSGKRGEVVSGARDAASQVEVFRVQFVDASVGYRGAGELELDRSGGAR